LKVQSHQLWTLAIGNYCETLLLAASTSLILWSMILAQSLFVIRFVAFTVYAGCCQMTCRLQYY